MSTKAMDNKYAKDLKNSALDQSVKVIPLAKINVLELDENE